MKWTISSDIRDQFAKGVHRDILIVPHATNVEPNPGGPPTITNKRPHMIYENDMWVPEYVDNQLVYDDVDWIIDNSVLIKEKFKFNHVLNSDDNLSFSGANAAMVQFTIRNKKEYIEELDEHEQPTGNWYWKEEIPNLQNYEFTKKAPDGTEKEIVGELEGNYIIEVYTYINGDSSTLMLLGMFRVEEDKVVDNGYSREITAYDFMTTFRDMDIFYWYKHLFEGINITQNDYEEFTKTTKEKDAEDPDAPGNWIRAAQSEWTIKDALVNLIDNLAAFDMIVWEDELDSKGKPTGKKICKKGMTVSNPSEYGRNYTEETEYSGYGMPIMIDPDILDPNAKPYIPSDTGSNEYERYGYMKILEMPFMASPSIIKSESLSMGKFLEDIGRLAGRYPFIRTDRLEPGDYVDPTQSQDNNKYNNYERCILSFKPLPSSKDDSAVAARPDMALSNHEIVKGFEHESYNVEDIELVEVGFEDKTKITYKRLNKSQRVLLQNGGPLQTYSFSDNMFASYLVTKSDDEEIKKKLDDYSRLRTKLFGTENANHNMSSNALFADGYANMRYRSYRPFKLTTYGDPCREVGDRILINFEDKITGEKGSFYSYILEKTTEGIQKMMDTYVAKGEISNPIFSNYQTGSKYQSSSSFAVQSIGYNPTTNTTGSVIAGMSPSDLVEYWRNMGIRLLDEPSECSAKFMTATESDMQYRLCYDGYWDENNDWVETWDGVVPTNGDTATHGFVKSVIPYEEDPPIPLDELYITPDNPVDMIDEYISPYYEYFDPYRFFYDTNGQWNVFELHDLLEDYYGNTITIEPYFKPDATTKNITINGNSHTAQYGDYFFTGEVDNFNTEDWFNEESGYNGVAFYIPPGLWANATSPNTSGMMNYDVNASTKKYVALKWTDPEDIMDYKPYPCNWEGTVIVRKENQPPKNRWDGIKIVRTTERDKYKTKPYKDTTIESGKVYYYGFFPYYTKISDPDHPILFYRFTKVIRVETDSVVYAPTIESIIVFNQTSVRVAYSIVMPSGVSYKEIKIYGKIDEEPACDDTDDVWEIIDDNQTHIDIDNLLRGNTYYFCIKCVDKNNTEIVSNVESAVIPL